MSSITRSALLLSAAMAVSAPAWARDYGVHTDGRMSVRGVPDASIKVAADDGGWTLALDLPGDGTRCKAELRDVSPIPGHLLKWIEPLPADEPTATVRLDPKRYLPAHTYRLALRCGLRELQHAYVHLLAPTDAIKQTRFELDEAARGDQSEITAVPKGAL
jgi:hypothetical protein